MVFDLYYNENEEYNSSNFTYHIVYKYTMYFQRLFIHAFNRDE